MHNTQSAPPSGAKKSLPHCGLTGSAGASNANAQYPYFTTIATTTATTTTTFHQSRQRQLEGKRHEINLNSFIDVLPLLATDQCQPPCRLLTVAAVDRHHRPLLLLAGLVCHLLPASPPPALVACCPCLSSLVAIPHRPSFDLVACHHHLPTLAGCLHRPPPSTLATSHGSRCQQSVALTAGTLMAYFPGGPSVVPQRCCYGRDIASSSSMGACSGPV